MLPWNAVFYSVVGRQIIMRSHRLHLPFVAVLCSVLVGCYTAYHSGRYNDDWIGPVPAPVLVTVLKTALQGWPSAGALDSSTPDMLQTSWKTIPGKRSGVLWWERKWEARISYLVIIKRDFGNPGSVSRFTVTATVEERPNDSYLWEPAANETAAEHASRLRAELISVAESAARDWRKP